MPRPRLRIIEPNLRGNAGHYAEFIRALAMRAACRLSQLEVHGGVGPDDLSLLAHPLVQVHPTFASSMRHGEASVIRSEALASRDPLLILTGKARHALVLERCARLECAAIDHCALYFHWREESMLQRLTAAIAARTRRDALAIAPTARTADFLRSSGWARVREIPYPALGPSEVKASSDQPRTLLVAGAARINKGLHLVAELCSRYERAGFPLPLLVQTTGKRADRHGRAEREPLARLGACRSPSLTLDPMAPDRREYARRFSGAIVLTPYDPIKFSDNVSGIALDALLHGAPVIATEGTWQSRLVSRFGAGVIMPTWDADALERAISMAIATWPSLTRNARTAASTLAAEHDPARLIDALLESE